jgi:hypothetical protein
MKEMAEQDRQPDEAASVRRKRITARVARVVMLLAGAFWLSLFVVAVGTGYLSWLGIAVGALLAGLPAAAPILGWMGRTRLERVFIAVHTGVLVLFLLAGIVAVLWPQGHGTWRPYRFDEELAALQAKRSVPDAENAARRYDAVFAGMDERDEPNFVFDGNSLRDQFARHPWKGSDYPQAALWLDAQSSTIAGLLEIGRIEKCRWPVQADMYDEYTVPYKKLRRSVLLLLAAGNRDLGEGRVTEALTKYFSILRAGDHLRQQSSQVDSVTGFGWERIGLHMIRHVLVHSNLSTEDLAQIAAHLPPVADPWPEAWKELLQHEKLHYLNLLGRLYEVNNAGRVRFARSIVISPEDEQERRNPDRWPWVYWLMSMPRDPQAVRGMVDRYFARFEQAIGSVSLPPTEEGNRSPRLSPQGVIRASCNFYRWWAEMAFFNEEEYVTHRRWCTETVTRRRGTWLVFGLRRYHDTHSAWPPMLDAISEYVPSEAFFDPTANEALVYARDGDSFKLHSKGLNRIDDGGRRGYVRALDKSEDDIWIWPPPEPKTQASDEEAGEMRRQLAEIYGKDYAEAYFKNRGSDKR